MKAFLLAAGLGTRMRPLTDKTPKCLLPINGKPLLQIWLELLSRYDVDQVLINTHWHHEKVEDFVKQRVNGYSLLVNRKGGVEKDGEKIRRWEGERAEVRGKQFHQSSIINHQSSIQNPGRSSRITNQQITNNSLKVRLFYEPELLGSAGTLLANRDWVADGEPFFVLYGDNLTDVNLLKMHEFHKHHEWTFTLGVFKSDEPERCGIADIDESGLVVDFVEKPENPKSNLAHAGINIADKRIFDFFPPNAEAIRPLDLGFHVIPNLVGEMKAYFIEEFLMDIGTPESYEKAQKIYPQITQIDAD